MLPWEVNGRIFTSSYATAGFAGRPSCSLLASGLPRWLCGVVGQLPRAGLVLTPFGGDEKLFLQIADVKLSGLIVHEADSRYRISSNGSDAAGFHSSISGIGFRLHVGNLEVSADDCNCYLPMGCRCEPTVPLPSWAPTVKVTRDDFDLLHRLALAPAVGLNLRAEGAGVRALLQVAGDEADYPQPLRLSELALSLPADGLAVTAQEMGLTGGALGLDLQPFIQAILFFFSDVFLGVVSRATVEAANRNSNLLASWANLALAPLLSNTPPPLPEPPSPYAQTISWPQLEVLRSLNNSSGRWALLPMARFAVGNLLEGGKMTWPRLDQLPLMHRLPALTFYGASLKIEPASAVVSGLDSLSALRLFAPVDGEPSSLGFALRLDRLSLDLNFALILTMPTVEGESLDESSARQLEQTPILYHADDAPLALPQTRLSLSLANLSVSALVFAPLSTGELVRTNWAYLPINCLLRPLRAISLRSLRCSVVPEHIWLESDLEQSQPHELEAHLIKLVSDAIAFLDESYFTAHGGHAPPAVIDALVRGLLMAKLNELLPPALDSLTGGCEAPAEAAPPAPVQWCRAPLVRLVSEELSALVANRVIDGLGLRDALYTGTVLSLPLDGVWLGPVRLELAHPRLENIGLFDLALLRADFAEPSTLRNTVGLGTASEPVRISFVFRAQLGCLSEGDRFGGRGCEWHEWNVSLSLASLVLHLDLNASLLQPYAPPQGVPTSLACAALPLQSLTLLPSTRLEVANWSEALLELRVTSRASPIGATVLTGWVYWLVSALTPDALALANNGIAAALAMAREACEPSGEAEAAKAEEKDEGGTKLLILLAIYGAAVLISGGIICAHWCTRDRTPTRDEAHTRVSLGAEQPLWQAALMTALCALCMGMFVSSQASGALGNLFIHVSVAGDALPVVNGFNITVADTVLEIWSSGSPPLALLVGGMSGTWPYVKMTLTLFALWAPPSLLPAGRRGAYLFFFDAFGKWSFFDVLLLHLLMAGFKLGFDVPSVPELPPDACGNALPLVSIATEVAPLEKVSLFIVALVLSLVLTNIVNHWHQISTLEAHRAFTSRLNAQKRRLSSLAAEAPQRGLPEPVGGLGRRRSLSQLSFEPVARAAATSQQISYAEAGHAPLGGETHRRLQLKHSHLELVKWCLVGAILLSLVALVTPSFAITVEGLVGNLINSQPGGSARRELSLFSMGDALGSSAPSIGPGVLAAHRYLFLLLVGVMPVIWLALCLVIWLVPMDPHTSHNFGLLAQVAYCYTGMDVLVVVVLATIFQLGAAVEFQFAAMTGHLDALIANYFADFVPKTSLTGVHTSISLGASFELGIGLVVLAAALGTAAGWTVMWSHSRLLHEETFLFPAQPLETLQHGSPEAQLPFRAADPSARDAATSHRPASFSDPPAARGASGKWWSVPEVASALSCGSRQGSGLPIVPKLDRVRML